ncbi:MAG: hypothetical protein J6B24_08460 [Clostridia bacterium]|nr:hypothetical protein [Clostridia bacterium]
MRRLFPATLSLLLALILLPSCSPAPNGFSAGRPITKDELASLSAELFTEAAEPNETVPEETEEVNGLTPDPHQTAYWVWNGSVYHLKRDCPRLADPQFCKQSTVRTAEDMGLRPCKHCAG